MAASVLFSAEQGEGATLGGETANIAADRLCSCHTAHRPGKLEEGRSNRVSDDTKAVIERAKRHYGDRFQAVLESQHQNRFVAIEPESGEYFLGDTFDDAVKAARTKYPDRMSHIIRIGHGTAFSHRRHAAVNGFVVPRPHPAN